jgi:hypothetical protein
VSTIKPNPKRHTGLKLFPPRVNNPTLGARKTWTNNSRQLKDSCNMRKSYDLAAPTTVWEWIIYSFPGGKNSGVSYCTSLRGFEQHIQLYVAVDRIRAHAFLSQKTNEGTQPIGNGRTDLCGPSREATERVYGYRAPSIMVHTAVDSTSIAVCVLLLFLLGNFMHRRFTLKNGVG